jgi:hypothetical protein
MPLRILALLATLTALLAALPARACPVRPDYLPPSNFELVQLADAIAVVTAEAEGGDADHPSVTFRVDRAVKGRPPARVTLGMAALGNRSPGNPDEFGMPHGQALSGACIHMNFARGGRYLLFLSHSAGGGWQQLFYPFARVNEDYAGEDTPWMRTVRRYLALQRRQLSAMAQLAALRTMLTRGRGPAGETLSLAERADIAAHLRTPSPWKPTVWLLALYERAERGAVPEEPPAAAGAESEAERSRRLLHADPSRPAGPDGANRLRATILTALANGRHPAALPLFERLAAAPDTGGRGYSLALRFMAANGFYARASRWIETRLMTRLTSMAPAEAQALIADVVELQRGLSGPDNEERWETDPHAAATWPEIELALYWHQLRTVGEEYAIPLGEAFDTIEVSDYRARPLLTAALGATNGGYAKGWAFRELERPRPAAAADVADDDDESEDPDLLPIRVLVSYWEEDRVARLTRAFCESPARRRLIILAIGQWGANLYQVLLDRIAGFPGLTGPEREALMNAAIEMNARHINEAGRAFLMGRTENWLVTRLSRGQPPDGPPLSCPG